MKGMLDKHFQQLEERYKEFCAQSPIAKALAGDPPTLDNTARIIAETIPDKTLGREYLERRTMVLNMHFWTDFFVNGTLAAYYNVDPHRAASFQRDILAELGSASKAEILAEQKLYPKSSLEKLRAIGRLRNAFAHHYPKGHPKLRYGKKSVFDPGVIAKIWKDVEEIVDCHFTAIEEMRRDRDVA